MQGDDDIFKQIVPVTCVSCDGTQCSYQINIITATQEVYLPIQNLDYTAKEEGEEGQPFNQLNKKKEKSKTNNLWECNYTDNMKRRKVRNKIKYMLCCMSNILLFYVLYRRVIQFTVSLVLSILSGIGWLHGWSPV